MRIRTYVDQAIESENRIVQAINTPGIPQKSKMWPKLMGIRSNIDRNIGKNNDARKLLLIIIERFADDVT